jgi:hypothetical protein
MSTENRYQQHPLEELMRNELSRTSAICALIVAGLAATATAQQPPAPPANPNPNANIVVENPTYATVNLEITVNKPVAEVWKRIGAYCGIAEWAQIPGGCKMLSGKEGDVGAVRSVANEIMVAKTEYSYTYTQPVRAGRPYDMYHGTLEARAASPTTTKLYYTLMYDNSMMTDDAAREKNRLGRAATFTRFLENMKTLAEGGTLPPPPARGK